jgi:hypothetical protein
MPTASTVHNGVQAEALGVQAGLDEGDEDLAEEGGQVHALLVEMDGVAPDLLQPMGEPVRMALGRRLAHVVLHDLEQVGMGLVGGLDPGVGPAGQQQDLERARGVEPLDLLGVDNAVGLAGAGRRQGFLGHAPDAAQAEHRPCAGDLDDGFSCALGVADRGLGVGHRR